MDVRALRMPRLDHLVHDERHFVFVRREDLVKHHLVHLARERAGEAEEELDDNVLALWRERRAAVGWWERRRQSKRTASTGRMRRRSGGGAGERRTAADFTARGSLWMFFSLGRSSNLIRQRDVCPTARSTASISDSLMSASKIAHRRLSGRTGSITQPIAIAADVDRGDGDRGLPRDAARRAASLALLRGATAADLRKRETEYGNAPHIVLCVYHDAPAVLEGNVADRLRSSRRRMASARVARSRTRHNACNRAATSSSRPARRRSSSTSPAHSADLARWRRSPAVAASSTAGTRSRRRWRARATGRAGPLRGVTPSAPRPRTGRRRAAFYFRAGGGARRVRRGRAVAEKFASSPPSLVRRAKQLQRLRRNARRREVAVSHRWEVGSAWRGGARARRRAVQHWRGRPAARAQHGGARRPARVRAGAGVGSFASTHRCAGVAARPAQGGRREGGAGAGGGCAEAAAEATEQKRQASPPRARRPWRLRRHAPRLPQGGARRRTTGAATRAGPRPSVRGGARGATRVAAAERAGREGGETETEPRARCSARSTRSRRSLSSRRTPSPPKAGGGGFGGGGLGGGARGGGEDRRAGGSCESCNATCCRLLARAAPTTSCARRRRWRTPLRGSASSMR